MVHIRQDKYLVEGVESLWTGALTSQDVNSFPWLTSMNNSAIVETCNLMLQIPRVWGDSGVVIMLVA